MLVGRQVSKVTAKFELAKSTSENSNRQLDFAQAHDLIITNTVFSKQGYSHCIMVPTKFTLET